MADSWENIATDPEFQAQPPETQRKVAHNFFLQNMTDSDFHALPSVKQKEISNNFVTQNLGELKPQPDTGLSGEFLGSAAEGFGNIATGIEGLARNAYETVRQSPLGGLGPKFTEQPSTPIAQPLIDWGQHQQELSNSGTIPRFGAYLAGQTVPYTAAMAIPGSILPKAEGMLPAIARSGVENAVAAGATSPDGSRINNAMVGGLIGSGATGLSGAVSSAFRGVPDGSPELGPPNDAKVRQSAPNDAIPAMQPFERPAPDPNGPPVTMSVPKQYRATPMEPDIPDLGPIGMNDVPPDMSNVMQQLPYVRNEAPNPFAIQRPRRINPEQNGGEINNGQEANAEEVSAPQNGAKTYAPLGEAEPVAESAQEHVNAGSDQEGNVLTTEEVFGKSPTNEQAEGPASTGVGSGPPTAKEPWQMTKDEFNKEAIYRGISNKTKDRANKYWTNNFPDAQQYGGDAVRIAYKSDIPDWIETENPQFQNPDEYTVDPELHTMQARAETPNGVDPHKFLVEKSLSEGKPVPPEVLADYPDLAAKFQPKEPVNEPKMGADAEHPRGQMAGIPESGGALQPDSTGRIKDQPEQVAEPGRSGEEAPPEPEEKLHSPKNAAVDKEREERGLEPIMSVARDDWGTVADKVLSKIEKNPKAGNDAVQDYSNRPRSFENEVDQALVEHRRIEVQNEYDKALHSMHEAVKSGDTEAASEMRQRSGVLHDQLQHVDEVLRKGGSALGGTLNARKMMLREDFSLARMTMEKEMANGGKPLSPIQEADVKAAHEKISALEKQLGEHQTRIGFLEKVISEKPYNPKPRSSGGYGSRNKLVSIEDAIKAKNELRAAMGHLNAGVLGIDPSLALPLAKIALFHFEAGAREFGAWSKSMVDDIGEGGRPYLKEAWLQAKDQYRIAHQQSNEVRLKSFKTRATNQAQELSAKTETGRLETAPKREPVALDAEGLKIKSNLERAKSDYRSVLEKDRWSKRTTAEKVMDTFTKWRRGFILSSPTVFAKLGSAAAQRLGITPIEEAVGAGIGKVIPGVASRAPRGGGLHPSAEAKAITDGFTKGMSDAWDTLKTGKSSLDVLYGKHGGMPPALIDYIGHLHGAIKAPVKRAEFARSFEKRTQWAINNGLDVTAPDVQTKIALESYKDANRAIFMQDNRVVDAYQRAVSALEQPSKLTGKPTVLGKAGATLMRTAIPVVRIPTNIVAETFSHVFGLASGSAQAINAYRKGIETLKPEEAETIMRQLKKGSLGAAGLAAGYFMADQIGGYYQSGKKRDSKDVQPGHMRIAGIDIPPALLHNPLMETLQIGASIRRIAESKARVHDKEAQGLGIGVIKSLLGLVEEVPFVREATEDAKIFGPEAGSVVGEEAKSLLVPQLVQWTAKMLDKDESGQTAKRKPSGIMQSIQSGIPYMRNELPLTSQLGQRVPMKHID